MNRRSYVFLACMSLMVGTMLFTLFTGIKPVDAAFVANNLMDDYTFQNVNTMNAGQIDNFLNSFPSSCISTNKGYAAADVTGYSPSGGFTYGGNVSAGTIIYHAAQAYGVNPEVILATMQKEQGLVVGGSSICGNSHSFQAAMGYDCPDGGACPASPAATGFSQQVIHATWLLAFGQQRSEGNTGWNESHGSWNDSDDPSTTYFGPMTQGNRAQVSGGSVAYYDGYTTIDGQSVHMDTGATAALYWYTPHFNGNQSFETIFQSWFGATTGQGFERVISDDTNDPRQWVVYGSIKQYIPDSQTIYAWNLQNTSLITMPASQLGAIPDGPTLGRLAVLQGSPTIYFMDNGQRHEIPYPSTFNAWNFAGQVISSVSPGLFTQASLGNNLTFSVQNPSTSNIYMVDGGNTSGQTVLRHYQNATLMAAWEGSSTNYTTVSTDYWSDINSAIGSELDNTMVTDGTNSYEVSGGVLYTLWPSTAQLYPGPAASVSGATFARLPAAGYLSHLVQSNDQPTVYLIDAGQKHQILWPNALTAWTGPNHAVSIVNDSFLSQIPNGTSIGGYLAQASGQLYLVDHYKAPVPASLTTAYASSGTVYQASAALMSVYITSSAQLTGFIQSPDSPSVYVLNNSGQLQHIGSPNQLVGFGGGSSVTRLSDYIVGAMAQGSSATMYVGDGTTNYVIDNGEKWSVSPTMATDWGLASPQIYSDSTLARFTTGGALSNDVRTPNGAYAMVAGGVAYATVDPNIAGVWNIQSAPTMSNVLIPNFVPTYMLTRFVQSNVQGDSRTFIIDGGNWYTIDSNQFVNLGGQGAPVMYMNPSNAPNTITPWTSVVVKDGGNNYYVIDGGTKRYFTSPVIYNQWTNSGALSTPTVTSSFLNLLPTSGWIERAIKGSSPSVYSAQNGAKQHILYPQTYNQYYAPFMQVSDSLINAMPTGSDIN